MRDDLRSFWGRFQTGVEVAAAGGSPDVLLGVRDGFRRYLEEGLRLSIPVVVVPHSREESRLGLWATDRETLRHARQAARSLHQELDGAYHFSVGVEGGLHALEVDGETRHFVRSWTVVTGPVGEAWGSSGSVELPARLLDDLGSGELHLAIPGTRRKGGLISSLTGGIETRRRAVATSTLHALASLFYGVLESRG